MRSLLFAVLQQAVAPAPSPLARVDVTPATAEIQIGQTLQLAARALDGGGRPVPGAAIAWHVASDNGDVDSTGLVTAGYRGPLRVTAVASLPGSDRRAVGEAVLTVVPTPADRIELAPAPSVVLEGTRFTFAGTTYSRQGDRRDDPIRYRSNNPAVAYVTLDGRFTARSPGRATITVSAGALTRTLNIQVGPNNIDKLTVSPITSDVLTGDVVRFEATGTTLHHIEKRDLIIRWALAANSGSATIDQDGVFVAELPGTYTVVASFGALSDEVMVRVKPRRVTRGMEVLDHLPLPVRSAEVWVHPAGTCAYVSSIADRVYAIDITNPTAAREIGRAHV